MKPNTEQAKLPQAEPGPKTATKDNLKTLPLAEVEKTCSRHQRRIILGAPEKMW